MDFLMLVFAMVMITLGGFYFQDRETNNKCKIQATICEEGLNILKEREGKMTEGKPFELSGKIYKCTEAEIK